MLQFLDAVESASFRQPIGLMTHDPEQLQPRNRNEAPVAAPADFPEDYPADLPEDVPENMPMEGGAFMVPLSHV